MSGLESKHDVNLRFEQTVKRKFDDDKGNKAIPWIASRKSSDQKGPCEMRHWKRFDP